MVWEVVRDSPGVQSTQTQRDVLTPAVQIDLADARNTAVADEERLVQLEARAEALTDVVVAISEQTQALTEAVHAIGDAAAAVNPSGRPSQNRHRTPKLRRLR